MARPQTRSRGQSGSPCYATRQDRRHPGLTVLLTWGTRGRDRCSGRAPPSKRAVSKRLRAGALVLAKLAPRRQPRLLSAACCAPPRTPYSLRREGAADRRVVAVAIVRPALAQEGNQPSGLPARRNRAFRRERSPHSRYRDDRIRDRAIVRRRRAWLPLPGECGRASGRAIVILMRPVVDRPQAVDDRSVSRVNASRKSPSQLTRVGGASSSNPAERWSGHRRRGCGCLCSNSALLGCGEGLLLSSGVTSFMCDRGGCRERQLTP
jgi:hypothetical protein